MCGGGGGGGGGGKRERERAKDRSDMYYTAVIYSVSLNASTFSLSALIEAYSE